MSLHWPTTGHYWIIFPLLLRDKIFCIRQLPAARPQSLQIIRWQSGGRENWMEDGGWNVILLRHVSDDWYTRAFTMKESLETLLNMQLINKIAWTFNNHWWFCQQRSLKSPVNKNIWSLISGKDKLFKYLFIRAGQMAICRPFAVVNKYESLTTSRRISTSSPASQPRPYQRDGVRKIR